MDISNVMQREQLCSEHAAYCFIEAKRRENRGRAMSEKVKVQITVTERVEYNQVVEMTLEEFQQLDKEIDDAKRSERQRAIEKICGFLDRSDICGFPDDSELDEFHLVQ